MAFEEEVLDVSFKANADLSSYQFYVVKMAADNTVDVCSGATDKPIGILQNKPTSGQIARVRVMGVSRFIIGAGGVAYGNRVGTAATGKGIVKSTNKDMYFGIALAAGNADEIGTVLLYPVRSLSA